MKNGHLSKPLYSIDLYCGSGAVTEAMKQEGIKVLAAIDCDPVACATYLANHNDVTVIQEDIRLVNPKEVRKILAFKDKIDLLVVCAPCQPFSNQNRKRSESDTRADLVFEACKFIEEFHPSVILFENVPGLTGSRRFEELSRRLTNLKYFLHKPQYIDSMDCGVPQRRIRAVMIASKEEAPFKDFYSRIKKRRPTTVRHAIGNLPPLNSGEASSVDKLHFARRHQPIVLKRLANIPVNGGSRESLPNELVLKCHMGLGKNEFPDVYGRMSWDQQSPTLTTGCTDVTKGRFAHPEQNRAITLREAARLQTFPDSFIFKGNSGQVARQIGNAVPVKMARVIVRAIIKCLGAREHSKQKCEN